MKTKFPHLLIITALALQCSALAQPVVTNFTTSVYAVVTDPVRLAFAPDGTLYAGRDASGSGGAYGAAVKIHRIAPGGSPVTEFGNSAVSDPDALIVDAVGAVSGTVGAVLVGGVHNDTMTGKIAKIVPDGTVTTLFGPNAMLYNPTHFLFDSTGRLLVTDNNSGHVLVTAGGEPTVLIMLAGANYMVQDAAGRLAVSSSSDDKLRLYGLDGELLNGNFATLKVGSPLARGPGGAWGTDLYAVAANGDLVRVDLQGNATNRVGSGFSSMQDLQFGPDGALYASDFNSDLIWRIAPPNCLAQPADLVGWWPGDGSAEDAAGPNNATAMGGLGYTNGMVGLAFDLNGSSAFAQVTAPTELPLGSQPRTLALWLKTPRNLTSATESALFQYGSDANGQMFGLITSGNAPGRLYFFGYNRDVAGSTPLAADTWYHAAATYDGTTVTLYLNGQPDGFRAVELNTALNANGLTIGYRPGGARWLGQLDEVMLFDRALATNEIAAIYAAGSRGVCPQASRPDLSVTRAGEQLMFTWASQAGTWYQLQSATNLPAAAWIPEGLPLAGTGGVLTANVSIGPEPQKFFRLRANR